MSKSLYLALLIACVYAAQSISAVPTEEFYAEGAGQLMGDDPHTFTIPLDPALPFYGNSYNGCVVSLIKKLWINLIMISQPDKHVWL